MAASTGPREALQKPGLIQQYAVGAVNINKGTLVSVRTDGFLYPARAGTATDIFVGVAYESVNNSAGVAGSAAIRALKSGSYVFATSSVTLQAQIGSPFYAADDETLTTIATSNQLVGYACEIVDANDLRIRIDRAVN